MWCFSEFCFVSVFLFVLGDNIFFVDALGGLDSNDGHTVENAKQSLHGALASSLPEFQKVYILPGLYSEFGYTDADKNDVEIVGSIRPGVSYNFINTSADDYTVESSYDVDDIETVVNYRENDEYMVYLYGDKSMSVRRVRFVGVQASTLFEVYDGRLTVRRCYFAGNCSCFHMNDPTAQLNISWSVFQPNSWNGLEEVVYVLDDAFYSITIGGSLFRNIKNSKGNGVVLNMNNTERVGGSVIIKDSDFLSCVGRNGTVLYVWKTKTIKIENSTFYHNLAHGRSAVLYLYGPAPSESSFYMENVWMKNNTHTNQTALGSIGRCISVRNISSDLYSDLFSNSTVVDVFVNDERSDNNFFVAFNDYDNVDIGFAKLLTIWDGDNETSFTIGLTNGSPIISDWVDYDLPGNYTQSDPPSQTVPYDHTPITGLSAQTAGIVVGIIWGVVGLAIAVMTIVYCICFGPAGCGCK